MKYSKKKLLSVARDVSSGNKITHEEVELLLSFDKVEKQSVAISLLKKAAVPVALIGGFLIVVFPNEAGSVAGALPWWTNLPEPAVRGADYVWNIIGEPVGKNNILYHLPNIVLYSFGVLGLKKIFDAIDRKTWVDKVYTAKSLLTSSIQAGTTALLLKKGHAVLFIGRGDFIGMQFVAGHVPSQAVVVSEEKPNYTNMWNYYNPNAGFNDLKTVIERTCSGSTGEYIFFPVKDDQIFLPSPTAYDLSPHRLDILCQDLRTIEKKNKWKAKKIFIVGDRFHKSFVQSEDQKGKVRNSEDIISLQTIAQKHENIALIDPTDIVLKRIIEIANGRKIVFRATKEGINEYKNRFYERLGALGYRASVRLKGVLTIGYDLFEDQTEQQTLARKIDDYYPVVLSKLVKDALIRNGYKKSEFIYVPDLVLNYLTKKASEQ